MHAVHRAPFLALAAALALLAVGCGHRPPRPIPGRVLVGEIDVQGNDYFDDDELIEGLALYRLYAARDDFDPFLVAADTDRIKGLYLRRGFFRVSVRSAVTQKGGLATIRFHVTEGPRSKLARVEIAGLPDDPKIDRKKLRGLIELEDGEPFRYEPYDEAKPALVAAIESAGYAYAKLEGKLAADRVRNEAVIRLEFTPGPLSSFGDVELEGVSGKLRTAALDRLRVVPGARYSSAALSDTQDALYDMGRFATVRIESERRRENPVVPIDIKVIQAPRNEVRLGGGVGVDPTSREVRGRASYRVAAWPFSLWTSFVELRPAYVFLRDDSDPQPRIEARATTERQDIFIPFLKGELEGSFEYRAFEAYTVYGPGGRLGLRAPVFRRIVEVAAGYQIRYLAFDRLDPAVDPATADDPGLAMRLGLDETNRLAFYEQAVYLDLRDNPVQPTLGLYGEVRLQEGGEAAGGQFDYLRVAPELRGYLPIGSSVLAVRGRIGTFRGDVPVTERYFAGGASSQRGFSERQLAPTATATTTDPDSGRMDVESAAYGGGALVESGVELRFPITEFKSLPIGGVTFLDGADVTETWDELDLLDQHWAAGLGVRVGTPIGPLRLDFGYRLNRTGTGEPAPDSTWAFHLSIGEAF